MSTPGPNDPKQTRFRILFELAAGAFTGRLRRLEVADRSMHPTLEDGDWVIGVANPKRPRVGDVIVCGLPGRPGFEIVKRIAAVDPTDATIWLAGDNPAAHSVDSSAFGAIPAEALTVRLGLRYHPRPLRLIR